jgi:hypothetical protein
MNGHALTTPTIAAIAAGWADGELVFFRDYNGPLTAAVAAGRLPELLTMLTSLQAAPTSRLARSPPPLSITAPC